MLDIALLPRPWSCHQPKVEGYEPQIKGTIERVSQSKRNGWRCSISVDNCTMFTSYHDTKAMAESKCKRMLEAYTESHYYSK